MYEVKAYRCDYCNKLKSQKGNMKLHETKCFKNPDSRSCITCKFFDSYRSNEEESQSDRLCERGLDISISLKTECIYHKTREDF